MKREPFIAHSELTNEIYIVAGKEKYRVTEQAIKAVKAIEALEQEPCEDAISRKAVQDYIAKYLSQYLYNDVRETAELIDEYIGELPSVKPQEPKTGHWKIIPFSNNHGEYRPNKYACSECGWEIDLCRGLQQDTGHRLFCEHCGARMEGDT